MIVWISVVKGLISIGLFRFAGSIAGALRSTVLAMPVSMFTPPVMVMVIGPEIARYAGKKNVPSACVLMPVSTSLTNTEAPRR